MLTYPVYACNYVFDGVFKVMYFTYFYRKMHDVKTFNWHGFPLGVITGNILLLYYCSSIIIFSYATCIIP